MDLSFVQFKLLEEWGRTLFSTLLLLPRTLLFLCFSLLFSFFIITTNICVFFYDKAGWKELFSQLMWSPNRTPPLTGPINKCRHNGIGEMLCILMVEQWPEQWCSSWTALPLNHLPRVCGWHSALVTVTLKHSSTAATARLYHCNKMLESLTWFGAIILSCLHGCALEILAGRIRSPFQWPWFITVPFLYFYLSRSLD